MDKTLSKQHLGSTTKESHKNRDEARCVCGKLADEVESSLSLKSPNVDKQSMKKKDRGNKNLVVGMHTEMTKFLEFTKKFFKDKAKVQEAEDIFENIRINHENAQDEKWFNKKCVDFRNQGNVFFSRGDYVLARKYYNKSISVAEDNTLRALAFANRSAALFHMTKYDECLNDIKRTLALDYPDKSKYKLYLREARCLKYLKKDFKSSLGNALLAVEKFHKGETLKLKLSVLKEMQQCAPIFMTKLPQPNDWTLPPLSYGVNKEVPGLSSAVSLVHNEQYGRHLVANRDIETGDVLVVENSIVSGVAPEALWDYCSYCIKYCLTMIPCETCCYAMYCNEECRDADWKRCHEGTCQNMKGTYFHENFLDEIDLWGELPGILDFKKSFFLCVVRLVSFFGMDNLKAALFEKSSLSSSEGVRTKGFDEDGKFTLSLKSVLSLEDNFDKIPADAKGQHCIAALSMVSCEDIPENQEELIAVAAIMMKFFMVVFYNYKTMHALNANYEVVGLARDDICLSVYLAGSMMNHACFHNVYTVMYGSNVVFRAKVPIQKGEQLFDCYRVTFTLYPLKERQQYCKEVTYFDCRCEACENDWPIVPRMPRLSVKRKETRKMMRAAGFNYEDCFESKKFNYLLSLTKPVDVKMLPQMTALLRMLHKSGNRLNQDYFGLQMSILCHYKAIGSCLYFNDAKEVLMGNRSFDSIGMDKFFERVANASLFEGRGGMKIFK